jgi:hypothetical protein
LPVPKKKIATREDCPETPRLLNRSRFLAWVASLASPASTVLAAQKPLNAVGHCNTLIHLASPKVESR